MKIVTRQITGWTDYPFTDLGDILFPNQRAPIRRVVVTGYDGDKYVSVIVEGQELSMKACYLYRAAGRLGQVKAINTDKLARAFGHDTIARYYAKRGVKTRR